MLALVCPVYNEAENAGPLLEAIARDVTVPCELTFVYDQDSDTTIPQIEARRSGYPIPIRLVRNRYGGGVLNAIRTGIDENLRADAIAVIMADLSDRLTDLNIMYDLVRRERYDVVCGSRYMRGGRQSGGPFVKRTLSRLAGLSLHVLTGIPTHDATNNFKMYSTAFLSRTTIESSAGFEVALELTTKAYAAGYRIAEVPTIWTDRVAGSSRFNLGKWLPHYLRWYFYALRARLFSRN